MRYVGPQIGVAETPRGIQVSLPARFWLLISLRRTIRGLQAAEVAWTYIAPARDALRVEQWMAEVDLQLAAEGRRRAWSTSEAEWSGAVAGPVAPASQFPPEPFVVQVPTPATTRGTLRLLDRLKRGERLVRTPAPGGLHTPRIFVLRPSDVVVRASVAWRAIDNGLIQPACDGLFGPDTSQTWFLPTVTPEEVRR